MLFGFYILLFLLFFKHLLKPIVLGHPAVSSE